MGVRSSRSRIKSVAREQPPSLAGRKVSQHTITAYQTDLRQFLEYLQSTNPLLNRVQDIIRSDITEYLSCLSERQLTGVTRARKLAAIKEWFRFLTDNEIIAKSPAESLSIPRKEQRQRSYLQLVAIRGILPFSSSSYRSGSGCRSVPT